MTKQIIEIVEFKLKSNVTDEQFLAATKTTDDIVKNLDGFIRRETCQVAEGHWIDMALWDSMEQAQAGAKAFEASPACVTLMDVIDMETASMRHVTVENSL